MEPNTEALANLLRRVYEHPDEAAIRGKAGLATVRSRFTWEQATAIAERRLCQLAENAPNRGRQKGDSEICPKVSLCMIVKNEEKNLPDCLASIRDAVDEIVIIDTGSTDGTRQIAASFGARVFDLPWSDSFADARNASIEHARGEWIFWMDADDRIDAGNLEKLKKLFLRLNDSEAAHVMKCLCVASAPGENSNRRRTCSPVSQRSRASLEVPCSRADSSRDSCRRR